RKVDFSCFGYHPDLESRLTFQEKWVIDANRPARTEQLFKVNDKMQMRRTSRWTDGSAKPGDTGWRALKKNVPGSLPAGPSFKTPAYGGPSG
ncbi:hypothetical protein, partial [Bradyrhizobium liaoningense]|uniref:hypothetical protein n=1 Tax=Bradyrhizobium liaoningense TaxID=43992 RepID=UPI001BAA8EE5